MTDPVGQADRPEQGMFRPGNHSYPRGVQDEVMNTQRTVQKVFSGRS